MTAQEGGLLRTKTPGVGGDRRDFHTANAE